MRDADREPILASTRSQLAGDRAHLQKLQAALQRTSLVIQQSTAAYQESRDLLDRIDGHPFAPMLSEIDLPD